MVSPLVGEGMDCLSNETDRGQVIWIVGIEEEGQQVSRDGVNQQRGRQMGHHERFSSLCSLSRGQCAVVEGLECDCADSCRLEEMGFRAGEMVTMLMPGCPSAVAVGETRLMVSSELLRGIRITPLG